MTTTVNIRRGEHQHPVPPNAVSFLREQLESRGIEGAYVAQWGPRVKGTPTQDRFQVIRPTDRNTVEVYLRPGGNDTAHIAWLRPENGRHGLAPEELYLALLAEPLQRTLEHDGKFVFVDDEDRVTRLLKLVAVAGPEPIPVEDLRAACNTVFGERTNMAWGQVFGAMERHGFLELLRDGTGRKIQGAVLTDKGRGRPGVQEILGAPEIPAIQDSDLAALKKRLETRGQDLMEKIAEMEQELEATLKKIDTLDEALKVMREVAM